MARLPHLLAERGLRTVFTLIEWNNWKSLDAHKSLGYESVGLVCCIQACGVARPAYRTSETRWQSPPGRIENVELVTSLREAAAPDYRGGSPQTRTP